MNHYRLEGFRLNQFTRCLCLFQFCTNLTYYCRGVVKRITDTITLYWRLEFWMLLCLCHSDFLTWCLRTEILINKPTFSTLLKMFLMSLGVGCFFLVQYKDKGSQFFSINSHYLWQPIVGSSVRGGRRIKCLRIKQVRNVSPCTLGECRDPYFVLYRSVYYN